MKDSTKYILDAMHNMTDAIFNKTKSSAETVVEFKRLVSRKQLEQCLIDESMDSEDLLAIKNMLKEFFNYEREIN
jgi:hypothetical protein